MEDSKDIVDMGKDIVAAFRSEPARHRRGGTLKHEVRHTPSHYGNLSTVLVEVSVVRFDESGNEIARGRAMSAHIVPEKSYMPVHVERYNYTAEGKLYVFRSSNIELQKISGEFWFPQALEYMEHSYDEHLGPVEEPIMIGRFENIRFAMNQEFKDGDFRASIPSTALIYDMGNDKVIREGVDPLFKYEEEMLLSDQSVDALRIDEIVGLKGISSPSTQPLDC